MQHFNSNGDDKTKFKSSNAESRFGVNLDKNGVQGNSDNTPEKGQPLSSPDLNSRFGIPETNSANYANNTERKGLSGAAIGIILLIIGAVMIGKLPKKKKKKHRNQLRSQLRTQSTSTFIHQKGI